MFEPSRPHHPTLFQANIRTARPTSSQPGQHPRRSDQHPRATSHRPTSADTIRLRNATPASYAMSDKGDNTWSVPPPSPRPPTAYTERRREELPDCVYRQTTAAYSLPGGSLWSSQAAAAGRASLAPHIGSSTNYSCSRRCPILGRSRSWWGLPSRLEQAA